MNLVTLNDFRLLGGKGVKYNLATKCICEKLDLGLYRHCKCSDPRIFPCRWCDTIQVTTMLCTFTMHRLPVTVHGPSNLNSFHCKALGIHEGSLRSIMLPKIF